MHCTAEGGGDEMDNKIRLSVVRCVLAGELFKLKQKRHERSKRICAKR